MAGRTGTHDITTLLAATTQNVARFGYDNIQAILDADMANWNVMIEQMVSDFAEISTDRLRIMGSSTNNYATRVNEYGRSATQLETPPSQVAFPLEIYQYATGWTQKYLIQATPYDIAIRQIAAQKSFYRAVMGAVKSALYLSANYTFPDYAVDNISLNVKRLANADGMAIPDGPNGEVFNGTTHTHYLANASLTAAAAIAAINTVIEHGYGGEVRVYIAAADEAAWRALAGFNAYLDPRLRAVIPVTGATGVPEGTLNITRLDNRPIGIFGSAEVWVKPWAIPNYALIFDSSPVNKTLVFRQRTQSELQGMRLAAEIDVFPMHAQYWEFEFGVGVWTRLNGAVLYYASGTYADPAITGYTTNN